MAGKTFPAFPAHAQPAILRIWQEAHGSEFELTKDTPYLTLTGELMWFLLWVFDDHCQREWNFDKIDFDALENIGRKMTAIKIHT